MITSEVDKKLLKATASEAANKKADAGKAVDIGNASPAQALQIAAGLEKA